MLLGLGHVHQQTGEYAHACEAYEQLIASFPDSDHARTIHVTVAQLQLAELEQPDKALAHFERYLQVEPVGPLAEEARVGRIRSLARLGRFAEVIEATDSFEAHHPASRACPEILRLRGDAYIGIGDPAGAASAFEEVLRRWPSSEQAAAAREGLAASEERPWR